MGQAFGPRTMHAADSESGLKKEKSAEELNWRDNDSRRRGHRRERGTWWE